MTADDLMSGYAGIADDLEGLYRDVHSHPELGHHETRTAGIIAERLDADGFEVHEGVGTTGVVGVLRNGDGPVVLLRADMDALPVREQTGLAYASTSRDSDEPVMHACGHDVHVAAALGAAKLLSGHRDVWAGTLVVVFQPSEEDATGARSMVEGGLVDLVPKPNVCLAQHVLAKPAGTVSVQPGAFLSIGSSLRVTVHGRGAHGSMPHLAIDPVVLAAMIVVRLQGLVSREVQPGEFAVLTVGSISAGTKSNIIDDRAVLQMNLRAYDTAVHDLLVAGIQRIVRAECAASGSGHEPEFETYDEYPLTSNDAGSARRVHDAFLAEFGSQLVEYGRQTASEDFSLIPDAFDAPYVYWGIGGTDPQVYAAAEASGTVSSLPANHSPFFAPVIEPTLQTGVRALVTGALAWLGR